MESRLLLMIVSALISQACSSQKDAGYNSPASPAGGEVIETVPRTLEKTVINSKLSEKNVSVEFQELPEPMEYKMIISWPEHIKHVQVSINKKIRENYNSNNLQNSHTAFVISGRTVEIELMAYNDLDTEPYSILKLYKKVPSDFVVSELVELTKDHTITIDGRFYFLRNGRIKTNGHALSISAKKLIVMDDHRPMTLMASHIITRYPGDPIKEDIDVRGSFLSITSQTGQGNLMIAMVGASGRSGGHTGLLSFFIDKQTEFSAYIFQRKGIPEPGVEGAPGTFGKIFHNIKNIYVEKQ
ncbi:hypothetical protein ACLWBD_00395 [Bdellovibrio sp. HCB117]|uniref:hypothetical protein n=1 Tax=Bdellovibrio sp. HCB117 TaxID=3394359 RepID=UPI0039B590DC